MTGPLAPLLRPEVLALRAYAVEDPGGLVKLDANENPYPPPPGLLARIGAAAERLALNRYPDPAAAQLRGLLARRIGWPEEGILLGNGSDELIVLLLAACGAPGASLLLPVPTFSMYRHIALVSGWRVEEVPLAPGFELDEQALGERAARTPPRLSVIASPNNPTGNCFDPGAVERLAAALPGIVVVDEAYHDFSGRTVLPLAASRPNVVVLRTLSKIGLAALRVGVLLAAPELARQLDKVRLPYNVGSFSQLAACAVLGEASYLEEQIRTIVAERARLLAALGALPAVTPFRSDANFILFRTGLPSGEVAGRLRREGVLVRDLGALEGSLHRCLRVTVGTPAENDLFLSAMRIALSG